MYTFLFGYNAVVCLAWFWLWIQAIVIKRLWCILLNFFINGQIFAAFEGRASAAPTLDLFITLLSLGSRGYRDLLTERKQMYKYLEEKLQECARNNGERLLDVRHNPISLGRFIKSKASS